MSGISGFRSPAAREKYRRAYAEALSECPDPVEVHDVDTRYGTTRVYRFGNGDGPPIVLLPATMATSAAYGELIPGFAERGPVYAVDTLGEAGLSVQRSPFAGPADRARCLDDVLERLHLTDVHVLGGSTGGWHAMNLAIHAPGRLASVSLLDPTQVTAGYSLPTLLYGAIAGLIGRDWSWRRWLCWSAGDDVAHRADIQLVLAGIRTYRSRVPFPARPGDDDIRSVRVPILAIFGGRSVVHDPIAAAERLRALQPRAEIETLPGAGHFLFLMERDRIRIVARVLDFVERTAHAQA